MGPGEEQPAGAIRQVDSRFDGPSERRQALDLEEESYIENHLVMLHLAYSAWNMEKNRTPFEKRAA